MSVLETDHPGEEAMLLAYATGGATDVTLSVKSYTWDGLCSRLMTPRVGNKDGSYYIRGGSLKANRRSDENLLDCELLILDGDSTFDPQTGEIASGAPPLPDVAEVLKGLNITFCAHTSHSARTKDNFWKYRIVIPAKIRSQAELSDCVDFLLAQLHGAGVYLADVIEAKKWSQPWFLPRVRTEEDKEHFVAIRNDALPFDVSAALDWAEGRRQAEAAIHKETTKPADHKPSETFQAFNDSVSLEAVRETLERAGYRFGYFDRRQQTYRYMRPGSESKTCGVVVFKGSQGHWCTYSHHGSADPLSNRVCDPFDLITTLEYNGDRKAAASALIPRPKEQSIVEQLSARQQIGEARPVTDASEAEPFIVNEPKKNTTEQKKTKRIELIPWDGLKDEPVQWLVKDILPAASFAAIYGKPGSGKSFLALHLGAMIASGRSVFGKDVTPGDVVYVAGEGDAGLKRRRDAIIYQHGLEETLPMHFVRAQLNLSTNLEDMEALFAAIREKAVSPSVIFFDTFARIFIGDENSAKDVGACIAILGAVQAEFNCCVVIIHHSAKHNDASMRGSSALLGAVDTELHCERIGSKASKDRIGSMTITKQKDGEDQMQFGFRMELVQLSDINPDVTSLAICEINKDELKEGIRKNARLPKLTLNQLNAYDALKLAIEQRSEILIANSDIVPPNTKCVHENVFREYYHNKVEEQEEEKNGENKNNIVKDTPKQRANRLSEAKSQLKQKGLIDNWNSYWYLLK